MKLLLAVILTLVAGVAFAAVNLENGQLQGQVQEVIDGGAYTYLRIRTKSSGDVWAATLPTKLQKGASVVIADAMLMTDFHSKALNRTFAEIVFGTARAAGATIPPATKAAAPAAKAATPAQTQPSPHGSGAKEPAVAIGRIDKATGAEGRTVVEVNQQSKQLAGKNVQVRGKVVKVSTNIMGRNWVHLRDGTGAADGSNDLLVTTTQTPKVGDVVLARGVVRVNADFGSGYSYPVLVEKATLK
jgi:membrane protein implicated in regulation of membrane protease activity